MALSVQATLINWFIQLGLPLITVILVITGIPKLRISGFDIRSKSVTLAGGGFTSCPDNLNCEGESPSVVLKELVLPVLSATACTVAAPGQPDIFCFGGVEGENACHGDSGSGVMYNDNNK